ncbi:hypothetical protein DH2020_032195 [Rehmannia glutinosa]|uniref:Reverse transcriptase Ty1/copia-type domain-containing protein n=1 Tax=Rehmannia glutinosa TaxID=99300 RepID=A0ABR0VJU6_REHGL
MEAEYSTLLKNKTWSLVPLPAEKRLVGCKWVYKVKRHADGSFARCKARLVAKGYTQTPGFDYLETFSPVVKQVTIRVVFSLAVTLGWKDLGIVHHFLGIEVTHSKYGLHMCQQQYAKDLLKRISMSSVKGAITPMVSSPSLSKVVGDSVADGTLYISVIGGLQYITITRPDLVYSVNKLSQYMQNPLDSHWKVVKRVLRYLTATSNFGLSFDKSPTLQITCYSDSDCATDLDDRKSITGFCVYLGNNLVSWCSKKQATIFRSSTEAEYRSLAHCATDVIWIRNLLTELHIPIVKTPVIWTDNIGAEALASNPVFHSRIKHVELDVHFIREKVNDGILSVQHVPSIDQTTDVLTKPLSKQSFTRFRSRLNVVPAPSPGSD